MHRILVIYILLIIFGCDKSSDITKSDIIGCMDEAACNYQVTATINDNCLYNNCIWDINFNFIQDIAGFQFNVSNITVTSASGGSASDAGFTISTGPSTVLGFSLSGGVIPYGEGILIQLEIDGDINDACITNPVISDPSGYGIDVRIENCNTIIQNETL